MTLVHDLTFCAKFQQSPFWVHECMTLLLNFSTIYKYMIYKGYLGWIAGNISHALLYRVMGELYGKVVHLVHYGKIRLKL